MRPAAFAAVRDLVGHGAAVVVGDLSDLEQARDVARQVNALGRMDAVIHNAGVYSGRSTPTQLAADEVRRCPPDAVRGARCTRGYPCGVRSSG